LRRALIAARWRRMRRFIAGRALTGLDPKQRALMKRLLERLMRRRLTLVAAVHHARICARHDAWIAFT